MVFKKSFDEKKDSNYLLNKNKQFFNKEWFIRILAFFIVLIPMLLIKNEFHMMDEYYYAIWLDKGEKTFHFYHILSLINGYISWFIVTILGFRVSAFRALQITSIIMSAIGVTALVDLARFWGLRFRKALLFSLPVVLAGGFTRYGTSAYPGAAAVGIGLLALNLLIKAVAKQEGSSKKTQFKSFYTKGLIAGAVSLLHIIFITLMPGFIVGIILRLRQQKRPSIQIFTVIRNYCLGFITILMIGYGFWFIISKLNPIMVEYLRSGISRFHSLFTLSRLIVNFKTFAAVFITGIHYPGYKLTLLFNVPRLLLVPAFLLLLCKAWKGRKNIPAISIWIIPLIISIVTIFFILFIFGQSLCRQYAIISLVAFGPLFLAIGISASKINPKLINFLMFFISLVFMLHMIFGSEGLYDIATHDSRPLRKLHDKCDIHRPKAIQFPWDVKECSLNPGCYGDSSYGSFGPSPSDMGLKD